MARSIVRAARCAREGGRCRRCVGRLVAGRVARVGHAERGVGMYDVQLPWCIVMRTVAYREMRP